MIIESKEESETTSTRPVVSASQIHEPSARAQHILSLLKAGSVVDVNAVQQSAPMKENSLPTNCDPFLVPQSNIFESTKEYPFHPAANIFPLLWDADLDALAQNIKEYGQQEPILLYHGSILDGRNRYLACQQAEVNPKFQEWTGTIDPYDFVIALNLHRRHLSDQQRAFIAARVKEGFTEDALQRQQEGLRTKLPVVSDDKGTSTSKAAEALQVSESAVAQASKVLKKGVPELIAAAQAEDVSLTAAAAVAGLPARRQRAAVAQKRVKELARSIRLGVMAPGRVDDALSVICQATLQHAVALDVIRRIAGNAKVEVWVPSTDAKENLAILSQLLLRQLLTLAPDEAAHYVSELARLVQGGQGQKS